MMGRMRTLALSVSAAALGLVAGIGPAPRPAECGAAGAYVDVSVEGFRVRVQSELHGNEMAWSYVERALRSDLGRIRAAVPGPALAVLRESTPIWVNDGVMIGGPGEEAKPGRGAVFHWSADWPAAHGLGPGRGPAVDIYSAGDYLDWRDHQPMMLLHELAHAYHARLGADREEILAAFRAARDSGRYAAVRYERGGRRPAYAMTNEMEYFAELSEAYFGRNDFEPFTRDELRVFDPEGYGMVERMWGLSAEELASPRGGAED